MAGAGRPVLWGQALRDGEWARLRQRRERFAAVASAARVLPDLVVEKGGWLFQFWWRYGTGGGYAWTIRVAEERGEQGRRGGREILE